MRILSVARAELPGKVIPLNLANQLGIAPDEIKDYLVKKEKDAVQKDDVLAENKPFIKWFKTEIRSPITGRVESIFYDHRTDPVAGTAAGAGTARLYRRHIVEVHPEQGVTVEFVCSLVQGIFGIGGEVQRRARYGRDGADEPLLPEQLTPSMKGKIVVGGASLSADTLTRAKEIGVVGLVVGGIHDKDLRALSWLRFWRGHYRLGTGRLYIDPHGRIWDDPDGSQNLLACCLPMPATRRLFQAPRKSAPASSGRKSSFRKNHCPPAPRPDRCS